MFIEFVRMSLPSSHELTRKVESILEEYGHFFIEFVGMKFPHLVQTMGTIPNIWARSRGWAALGCACKAWAVFSFA